MAAWIDGAVTSAALLAPMVLAFLEIIRLARLLPPPGRTDLFSPPAASLLAGRPSGVPAGNLDGPPHRLQGLSRKPRLGTLKGRPSRPGPPCLRLHQPWPGSAIRSGGVKPCQD